MKQMKFRAWDKLNNKMVNVEDVDLITETFPSLLAIGLHGLPIVIDNTSFESNEIIGWNVDHRYVLMQFIGRKDKNGTEIFEGDIVENDDEIGTIYYDKEDAMFCIQFDNIILNFGDENSKWWEVIGNIHDNPELLGVSE